MTIKGKNIALIISAVVGSALLIQGVRYNICKSNVKKALLDPTLQEKYKSCTSDGFHKKELEGASHFTTSATIKIFPFSIELTKWNNSDEIYWNDVK